MPARLYSRVKWATKCTDGSEKRKRGKKYKVGWEWFYFTKKRVYGCSYKGILYNGGNVVYFYIAVEDILL